MLIFLGCRREAAEYLAAHVEGCPRLLPDVRPADPDDPLVVSETAIDRALQEADRPIRADVAMLWRVFEAFAGKKQLNVLELVELRGDWAQAVAVAFGIAIGAMHQPVTEPKTEESP